MEIVHF